MGQFASLGEPALRPRQSYRHVKKGAAVAVAPQTLVAGRFLPAADTERRPFLVLLGIAHLGPSALAFALIQVLLPVRALEIAGGDGKADALSITLTVGVLGSLLGVPLIGALSDRIGARKPFIAFGCGALLFALANLSQQATVVGLALAWLLVQACSNITYAPLIAVLADVIPGSSRGLAAGVVALGTTLGLVLGVAFVTFAVPDPAHAFLAMGGLFIATQIPLLVGWVEKPLPIRDIPSLRGLWIGFTDFMFRPDVAPDFRRVWVSRLLLGLTTALTTVYLLYFLMDRVGLSEPDAAATLSGLVLLYAVSTIAATVVAGYFSDRIGRRVPIVVASCALLAVSTAVIALSTSMPLVYVGVVLTGLGYGVFLSVDQALITQVLPSSTDHARDLGAINVAISLPQLIAPIVAAALFAALGGPTGFGYQALFFAASCCAAASAYYISRIRSVR
jgi:MFS family permease